MLLSGFLWTMLAGVGIAEWLSGTSTSVPSSHGTAGRESHLLATMWTSLHRVTGCSQHDARFPLSKGREKVRARGTSRPTQPSVASVFYDQSQK